MSRLLPIITPNLAHLCGGHSFIARLLPYAVSAERCCWIQCCHLVLHLGHLSQAAAHCSAEAALPGSAAMCNTRSALSTCWWFLALASAWDAASPSLWTVSLVNFIHTAGLALCPIIWRNQSCDFDYSARTRAHFCPLQPVYWLQYWGFVACQEDVSLPQARP